VDDLTAALTTAGLVGIAELGDKSQVACFLLASRQPPWTVVAGAALAFAALNGLAVGLGGALGASLPITPVRVGAGLLFVVFAAQSLRAAWRPPAADDGAPAVPAGRHPAMAAAWALGMAELGDKTQLTVAGLGAVQPALGTWVGGTVALVATSAAAALAGQALLGRVPRRAVDLVAGLGFLVLGGALLVQAAGA
jgi:putative Ca2+/H+ antiporter (TMEM165/GDT1 family)